MSLDSNFVAKVVTIKSPDNGGGFIVGTAYAIREGVIITAYHVIPNIADYAKHQDSYLRWEILEDKTLITNILYESQQYDIVIAECDTPPNVPSIICNKDRPSSSENWTSYGYAKSAIDVDNNERKQETAAGSYFDTPKKDHIQQLESKADTIDRGYWRGMSGAPIFTANSNKLTAIFIETSLEYKTEQDEKLPIFGNRLRAVSIARLLEVSDDFSKLYTVKSTIAIKNVIKND